jgi:tetratricopeptide (TPR) repeat protein
MNLSQRSSPCKFLNRGSAKISFKDKEMGIPEIAAKLNVNYILEGSVRTFDSLIRISVKLVETKNDNNIWSQQWDKELKNIFQIQNEISEAVAENLQLRILDNIIPKVKEAHTQAYAKYLEARYDYPNAMADDEFMAVEAKIKQSIAIDSTYAPAWILLGRIYHTQNNYGVMTKEEGYKKIQYAAKRAKQIDSTNAEVYTLLSLIALDYERDFKKAGILANTALQLEPNNSKAIERATEIAFFQNNFEEAIRLHKKSLSLDPVNDTNFYLAANTYYAAKQFDEAIKLINEAIRLSPKEELSYSLKATILMRQGKYKEALEVVNIEPLEGFKLHVKAMIYHYMGNQIEAEATLKKFIENYEDSFTYQIALNYAELKESEKVYYWLEKAYELEDFGLIELHTEQGFDAYRNEPQFKKIVEMIGYKY